MSPITKDLAETIEELRTQLAQVTAERDQAKQDLADRKVIERAKGLLMEQHQLTEAEAYRRLRTWSQRMNQRIVEVAQSVITAAAVGSDEG